MYIILHTYPKHSSHSGGVPAFVLAPNKAIILTSSTNLLLVSKIIPRC